MIAGHDRFHLAQARRALEALRDVARAQPQRSPEDRRQQRRGALLVERLVAVAALGRLHARGAPARARTLLDGLERRREPALRRPEPALDDAGAARIAVVDEDRAEPRVRVQRRRHAAHVPPVARGDQRQQPDRGVLGRVDGAGQIARGDRGPVDDRLRDRPPHGLRLEVLRRERQRDLVDDVVRGDELHHVAHHLVRDAHGAEERVDVAGPALFADVDHLDVGDVARLRVVVGVRLVHHGDARHQVQLVDQVLVALMQVDGARVQRRVRAVLVGRAEQLARLADHDRVDVSRAGPDVDRPVRRLAPAVVPGVLAPHQLFALDHAVDRASRRRARRRSSRAPPRAAAARARRIAGAAPARTGSSGRSRPPRPACRTGPRDGARGTGRAGRPAPPGSRASRCRDGRHGRPAATSTRACPG